MRRRKRVLAVSAWIILLLALCIPTFSGSLAEEDNLIDVPIGQTTEVFDEKGNSIGTLQLDPESGLIYQASSGEQITGVRVRYAPAAVKSTKQSDALIGKTKVQLSLSQVATPAPETTAAETAVVLPEYGWIDTNLVNTALSARLSVDNSRAKTYEAEIASLRESLANAQKSQTDDPIPTVNPVPEADQQNTGSWVAYAALALGVVCAGALGWIALSVYASKVEKELQTEQLKKLNDRFTAGVSLNSPVKVEQTSWPKDARVEVVSDSLGRMAANLEHSAAFVSRITPAEPAKKIEPPSIPEGEEPDLLALANSLSGVASSTEWRRIVKDAGWHYELLQSNPSDKGNYIADESGYSIIAALLRGAEADLAYVVPSYQDPKASEDRWSEFYSVNRDYAVKDYRVDKLPVMFIDRGVFFLLKSPGRLTRRP